MAIKANIQKIKIWLLPAAFLACIVMQFLDIAQISCAGRIRDLSGIRILLWEHREIAFAEYPQGLPAYWTTATILLTLLLIFLYSYDREISYRFITIICIASAFCMSMERLELLCNFTRSAKVELCGAYWALFFAYVTMGVFFHLNPIKVQEGSSEPSSRLTINIVTGTASDADNKQRQAKNQPGEA